ncbi:hypothetical protein N8766_03945 [bacterium]|nr:hypothetical protein [bacterium]
MAAVFSMFGFLFFTPTTAMGGNPSGAAMGTLFGIVTFRLWFRRRVDNTINRGDAKKGFFKSVYFPALLSYSWRSLTMIFGLIIISALLLGNEILVGKLLAAMLVQWTIATVLALDVPFWTPSSPLKNKNGSIVVGTCAIIALLTGIGVVLIRLENERNQEVKRLTRELHQKNALHMLDRIDQSGEAYENDKERLERLAELESTAQYLSGEVKEGALVVARFQRELSNSLASFSKQADGLLAGESLYDVNQLEDSERINRKLVQLNNLNKVYLEAYEKVRQIPVSIKKAFRNIPMNTATKNAVVTNCLVALQFTNILRMRQLDLSITEEAIEVIELLRDEYGRWTTGEDGLIFESESVVSQFNTHNENVYRLADEQLALQRKIFEIQASK